MKCTQCGNELASGARFCNHCGAPVIQWTEDTMEKVTEEKTDGMVPSGASQVKKRTAWIPFAPSPKMAKIHGTTALPLIIPQLK